MIKHQFTAYFISIHHKISRMDIDLKGAFWGPLFFLSLFFTSCNAYCEIKLALIDTGFCPGKIAAKKKITIENMIDLTSSVKIDCQKYDSRDGRFHGQLVLEEFLKFYNPKNEILHIYPLIIFNSAGEQKIDYWLKSIDWVKKEKIDIVLTAAGFMGTEKISNSLPAIWFVPSGRITPKVLGIGSLFPQSLAPLKNLFLIGDFYDGRQVLYDQGLLYKEFIDYYFPSGAGHFTGTSRAVAEACAKAISLCPIKTMRECLLKSSKVYIDNLSHNTIRTF